MIFEGLSDKLQGAFSKLKSKGKLTEKDVKAAMREVKLALLEADVNFKVVKDFVKKVQERCVGQEVMESLTPAQHVIKIVNEELTALMGDVQSKITISSKPPTIIMMVGLQGAGKTTTSGKLGGYFIFNLFSSSHRLGDYEITADEVLGGIAPKANKLEQAKQMLRELAETTNMVQSNEVFEMADEQGISKRTLENAKKELGIRAKKINN